MVEPETRLISFRLALFVLTMEVRSSTVAPGTGGAGIPNIHQDKCVWRYLLHTMRLVLALSKPETERFGSYSSSRRPHRLSILTCGA